MASRPRPAPLTDADRAEILRRHAAGEPRNALARAVGRSGSTVSKVVAEAGLSFERGPEVIAATAARVTDLAARRARLADDLLSDAERLRQQLWEPHEYFDWGGKDHDFDTHTTPEPSPADKRSIMATVATAVDRSLKLEPPKDENGADAVGSLLGGLLDRLRADHGDG
jgi:hypothetical protein